MTLYCWAPFFLDLRLLQPCPKASSRTMAPEGCVTCPHHEKHALKNPALLITIAAVMHDYTAGRFYEWPEKLALRHGSQHPNNLLLMHIREPHVCSHGVLSSSSLEPPNQNFRLIYSKHIRSSRIPQRHNQFLA